MFSPFLAGRAFFLVMDGSESATNDGLQQPGNKAHFFNEKTIDILVFVPEVIHFCYISSN